MLPSPDLFRRLLRRSLRLAIDRWTDVAQGAFVRRLQSCGALHLVFDHRMGGGSNIFRERMVEGLVERGEAAVLLVTIGRDDRQVECLLYQRHRTLRHRPASVAELLSWLGGLRYAEVVVNDLVTWPAPADMANWIGAVVRQSGTPLTVYVHDHFFLCPSWTLLDHDGRFCNLPEDLTTCDRCLAAHADRFVRESDIPAMAPWRDASGALLQSANRLVCFSNATAELMRRGHKGRELRIEVRPHQLLFVPDRMPSPRPTEPLCIGVLGNIGYHKGAVIVERLAQLIEERGIDAKIVILGRFSRQARPGIVVHGGYDRRDLAALIERYGVNVFLFPSIWPETFSYVCAEIMALRMPLVAFDLGAPAERIRDYPLGLLVSEVTADGALQGVLTLREALVRVPVEADGPSSRTFQNRRAG